MTGLGAQGKRVMAALESGATARRAGDGWRVGTLAVPASLAAELARRDLAREADGVLRLTGAGRGWGQRTARPELPNRLLAERTIPGNEGEARPGRAVRRATVNLAESPLGWLKARGLVDARQFEAGERLRADWTMAQLGPRVTMRWDAAPHGMRRGPDAPLDPTLAQVAARRRTDDALAAVGPGLRDVLWRVACAGEGMATAEAALGWPARAGRVVLTLALDRLADHYGLG